MQLISHDGVNVLMWAAIFSFVAYVVYLHIAMLGGK